MGTCFGTPGSVTGRRGGSFCALAGPVGLAEPAELAGPARLPGLAAGVALVGAPVIAGVTLVAPDAAVIPVFGGGATGTGAFACDAGTATLPEAAGKAGAAAGCPSFKLASTAAKISTRNGSHWVPAPLRKDSTALSWVIAFRYGRSEIIA